ncbi:stage II sporulation protein M [Parachryseolinea silvisoli]|uniref:stage II sporulation protein M n=1 Tax=Parachryseolinea silvisoli TaxID=2873601 RepID=UPI002265EEAE|nr:stage II sporulation protein M [Parachryseolinea silvisoli]MCD9016056.1 stage II sporulation protein M [Parachryseolinea silvisoli]
MREAAFVKRNQARWQEFERTLSAQAASTPDKLAEVFIQITDDLSFARTQYPDSRVTTYLNNLASKIHLEIYKNKKEDRSRFRTFWTHEIPSAVYASRKQMLYALLIFLIAGAVGVVSTLYDDTFTRLILGDYYVNMTLENIHNGNPTAVYEGGNESDMFFRITLNNIMVALRAFAVGAVSSIFTGLLLFYNGLMVGTFLTFFYTEQQLAQGAPVVMLHGTIELTSIVIAGGAGLVMGNSLLFPGTYSRMASFKRGALRGVKIAVGLVPFFIVAGFIESFVTRYAFMHWGLKVLIIGLSAFIMLFYFVYHPYRLAKHGKLHVD